MTFDGPTIDKMLTDALTDAKQASKHTPKEWNGDRCREEAGWQRLTLIVLAEMRTTLKGLKSRSFWAGFTVPKLGMNIPYVIVVLGMVIYGTLMFANPDDDPLKPLEKFLGRGGPDVPIVLPVTGGNP